MNSIVHDIIRSRVNVLKAMDSAVRNMNHEDAFDFWIIDVPDEASEDDFLYIAQDTEEYTRVVHRYAVIMIDYGKYDLPKEK